MAQIISLPSEILREICLHVLLVTPSDIIPEYSVLPTELDTPSQNRLALISAYSNSKALSSSLVANISALHNCAGGKVDDIYRALTTHRCPLKSLLSLNLTCKRLHEVAEPLLWKLVETDQESTGSIGDLVRILHTVSRRPELRRQVKALAFRHFRLDTTFITLFDPDEKRSMGRILQWDATHQVAALLDLLPNLQNLKLSIESIPVYFSVFQPSVLYRSGFPLGLQNLTVFSLHWEDPGCDAFRAEILLPLFLLPNLKTLYLGHPMAAAGRTQNLPDSTRYYGASKITDLVIDFGSVEVPAIKAFLKLPGALEKFSYSYGGRSNRCGNARIGQYFSALLPQKKSLRTLKIRGCRDMQVSMDETAPDPAILGAFTTLTEFACPVRLLIFRNDFLGEEDYKLEDDLPTQVEKLTLFAYDDWTFDNLSDELKHFFDFGRKKYENLKEMKVEIWLKEEDYEMHGWKRTDGERGEEKEGALGVIRGRVENLKTRGKDRKVRLEVELDTLSKTELW